MGVIHKVLNQHLQLLVERESFPFSKWLCSQVEVNRGQEGLDGGNGDPDSVESQDLLMS